ncbi:hypothetical protein GCM10011519_29740 [Marmoricola endophyticus]|uniref:YcaO domain-containing protein n=1 Tax=Marmoricola endophyticus TaxID=2040280 RepID=A0A917F742_9ACTN|nr:YcaO-like family protein [Marmoricola endophyticus]GGF53896.1 hypothetical protein GCM10011519_29740 [Marmoricola endophyticus]
MTDTGSSVPASLRAVERLVSPYGLVNASAVVPRAPGDPRFTVHASYVGNPGAVLGGLSGWSHDVNMGNMNGVGSDLDPERARLVSVAEALERYSLCAWRDEDLVTAPETALAADDVVSPARWPRPSDAELAAQACGLRRYDPSLPIRWVRGWSLTRGREVLVPAVTVYMHMVPISDSELFTRGVTTGAAVHSDPEEAVLSGALEVVERDALTLAWLLRRRLPALRVAEADLSAADAQAVRTGSATHLEVRLFDATTDLGIPVVYALQLSEHEPRVAQMVCATCDLEPGRAVGKIHRELAALRVALRDYVAQHPSSRPADDAVSVLAGAAYQGQRERRGSFSHLLDGERAVHDLGDLPRVPASASRLAHVVDRVGSRGGEVIVVDVTTDEARSVGMTGVKVLVPEAVPLSFIHAERYLATPRLREAAARTDDAASSDINPEPQPFA